MIFVKRDDLKMGMRLAKPIYNKKGVLLYDRDSKLTYQSIDSIRNFGLIGIYVLEPAEPLPPMTDEDREFEKFQAVSEFELGDELTALLKTGKQTKLRNLAESYISSFGRLNHKVNFIQNLRSNEDYVFKHSSNVAILCSMMSHVVGMHHEEQQETILAALVHDIGKLNIKPELLKKEELEPDDVIEMRRCEYAGIQIVENTFLSVPSIKRTVLQTYKHIEGFYSGKNPDEGKLVLSAKILIVAEMFDSLTAMDIRKEPHSFFGALKILMKYPEWFDPDIVKALVKSINILNEGNCVELSNGERALVLSTDPDNVLKPLVLVFSSNTIIDLARSFMYDGLEIVDIVKSLDNRHSMKNDTPEDE